MRVKVTAPPAGTKELLVHSALITHRLRPGAYNPTIATTIPTGLIFSLPLQDARAS